MGADACLTDAAQAVLTAAVRGTSLQHTLPVSATSGASASALITLASCTQGASTLRAAALHVLAGSDSASAATMLQNEIELPWTLVRAVAQAKSGCRAEAVDSLQQLTASNAPGEMTNWATLLAWCWAAEDPPPDSHTALTALAKRSDGATSALAWLQLADWSARAAVNGDAAQHTAAVHAYSMALSLGCGSPLGTSRSLLVLLHALAGAAGAAHCDAPSTQGPSALVDAVPRVALTAWSEWLPQLLSIAAADAAAGRLRGQAAELLMRLAGADPTRVAYAALARQHTSDNTPHNRTHFKPFCGSVAMATGVGLQPVRGHYYLPDYCCAPLIYM